MKVTFCGTRGSTPVSSPNQVKYGGNTTCLRIESDCLPAGMWLVLDAGTGIVPLSWSFMKDGGKEVTILHTHYHHDHTQGLLLSVFPFIKQIPVHIYGPYEHGIGPRAVYETLMRPPLFPVDLREIGAHMKFGNLEFPNATVLLIHPEGGLKKLTLEDYERLANDGKQMPFRKGRFALDECLVVRMHHSNHPERTISYRLEERPTGKVFVFLTDHENQDGISATLKAHVNGADLMVEDCQYTDKKYAERTSGWGHATPSYVSRLAIAGAVKRLGLTHHDPPSSDEVVDEIVAAAAALLEDKNIEVFGCADYMVVEV